MCTACVIGPHLTVYDLQPQTLVNANEMLATHLIVYLHLLDLTDVFCAEARVIDLASLKLRGSSI